MSVDVILLCVGVAFPVTGGHALVFGASQLVESFGVSDLVIGLTVVAFVLALDRIRGSSSSSIVPMG